MYVQQWSQQSRPTRGGTVRQQTTPANRDHLYPDSVSGFSASAQFAAAELILNSTTKPTGPYPTPAPTDGGRHTSESRTTAKYPCPVCARDVKLVMTAHSTFYSSTLMESATN